MIGDDETEVLVPDAIEPIVALRAFRYDGRPSSPGLISLTRAREKWTEHGWTRARCSTFLGDVLFSRPPSHRAPMEGCTCGLYALKVGPNTPTLARLAWDIGAGHPARSIVIGRVQLAGKIIEHELGYRAELARIVELIPVSSQRGLAKRLARTYAARVSDELREDTHGGRSPENESALSFEAVLRRLSTEDLGIKSSGGKSLRVILGWPGTWPHNLNGSPLARRRSSDFPQA
jgi:hypothetical protein